MTNRMTALLLAGTIVLTGCNIGSTASLTPTQIAAPLLEFVGTDTPSPTPVETFTPVPTSTATPIPPVAPAVCTDPQVSTLLDSLKQSMLTANGKLLSSLVASRGMEVRYFRNGKVLRYSPYQAKFLYVTTYQAKWGTDPASGLEKRGAFHDVIVPALVTIFSQPYTIHCNEIRHGGATYEVTWPYKKDFYSIHFAGTEQNGYLDWRTWVVGVEYINGKPCIYALMQFYWEP